jgi:hypothetical protein
MKHPIKFECADEQNQQDQRGQDPRPKKSAQQHNVNNAEVRDELRLAIAPDGHSSLRLAE